jgi:hypothetical protein
MAESEAHMDSVHNGAVDDVEMGGEEAVDGPGQGDESSLLADIEPEVPAMTTFLE